MVLHCRDVPSLWEHTGSASAFLIAVFLKFPFMPHILHEDMLKTRAMIDNTPQLTLESKTDTSVLRITTHGTAKHFSCHFPFLALLIFPY